MMQVIAREFGAPEVLEVVDAPDVVPVAGEVRVAITSIGLNHADLMARRGEYRLYSGDPPFVPGLEAGGIVEAVGEGVSSPAAGTRVVIAPDAPRNRGTGGTYRSHIIVPAEAAIPVPDAIPDDQLGAIWLPYLTAYGCLAWKQGARQGQFVVIPAASSSVAWAAAQVAADRGAVPIGLTTSAGKIDAIMAQAGCKFESVLATRNGDGTETDWTRQLKRRTGGRGVDVFFDPVAAGEFLQAEIRLLAQGGTIWVYGLLGTPGALDVTPLIRKWAAIRGWVNGEILADKAALREAVDAILAGFAEGRYNQHIARAYPMDEVVLAHREMELGRHVGKLVLVP